MQVTNNFDSIPLSILSLKENFFDACMTGNLNEIKRISSEDKSILYEEKVTGATPFFAAALNGQLEAGKLLLSLGFDLNRKNKSGFTNFIFCISYFYFKGLRHIREWYELMAEYPLDIKFDPSLINSNKACFLEDFLKNPYPQFFQRACYEGDLAEIEYLLKKFSHVLYEENCHGFTGFDLAAANKQFGVVKLLLDLGYDIHRPHSLGWDSISLFFEEVLVKIKNNDLTFSELSFYLNLFLEHKEHINFIFVNKKSLVDHFIEAYDENSLSFSFLEQCFKSEELKSIFDLKVPRCDMGLLFKALSCSSYEKVNQLSSLFIELGANLDGLSFEAMSDFENLGMCLDAYRRLLDLSQAYLLRKRHLDACLLNDEIFRLINQKLENLKSTVNWDLLIANKDKNFLRKELIQKLSVFQGKIEPLDSLDGVNIEKFFLDRCLNGDIETIKALLEISPKLKMDNQTYGLAFCLIGAALEISYTNNLASAKALIHAGFDVNALEDGKSAIQIVVSRFLTLKYTVQKKWFETFEFLLQNGSKVNYSFQGKGFIQILLTYSFSPLLLNYLFQWVKDPKINLNFNLIDETGKSPLEIVLKTLSSTDQLLFLSLFKDYPFKINVDLKHPDLNLSDHASSQLKNQMNKMTSQLLSSIQEFAKYKKINVPKSLEALKNIFSIKEEMKELAGKEKTTPKFSNFLLSNSFQGILKKEHLENSLEMTCETRLYLDVLVKLFEKYPGLKIQTSGLKIRVFGLNEMHLSESQMKTFKKKYFTALKREPAPKISSSPPSFSESFIPAFQTGAASSPKGPRSSKPNKKALLTEQIRNNLFAKHKERKNQKPVKQVNIQNITKEKEKKPKLKKTASTPVITGNSLSEKELKRLLERKAANNFTVLPKKGDEEFFLPEKSLKKNKFSFVEGQENRLTVAINAAQSLKEILENLNISPSCFLEEDKFCQVKKKSIAYHLLRFFESLAPTSNDKDDERDLLFFTAIDKFFLSKEEMRKVRNSIRSSFTQIPGLQLFKLAKLIISQKTDSKLIFLLKNKKIPSNCTRLLDPLILKFAFNFENELKSMDETKKASVLTEIIRGEDEFIAYCIKSSENQKAFSLYLDAIKLSLSIISKMASFMKEVKKGKLFSLVQLGNKVAHHLDQNILLGQPIDEVDIAHIWSLYTE